MQFLLTHVLMRRQAKDSVWILAEALGFVEGEELEVCTLIILQLKFQLHQWRSAIFQWLNASIVLPDEALQLCRSISKLGTRLTQNLVRIRFVHVVRRSHASFIQLVSLDEGTRYWIVFLKLEIARSLVVAQCACDSQILRSSIKHYSCRLACWWTHIHRSHVYSIISAIERDLEIKVVLIVFIGIRYLRH